MHSVYGIQHLTFYINTVYVFHIWHTTFYIPYVNTAYAFRTQHTTFLGLAQPYDRIYAVSSVRRISGTVFEISDRI